MQKYQGSVKIEDIKIGQKFYNLQSKQFSTVTEKTSNTVELFNLRMSKKGVNSKCWYDMTWFNRLFLSETDVS